MATDAMSKGLCVIESGGASGGAVARGARLPRPEVPRMKMKELLVRDDLNGLIA